MSFTAALGAAIWLGILTSISPCPLATNIAAISFISRKLESRPAILLAGLMYTLGRMAAYLAIGLLAINGILAIPALSNFLQSYMHEALGPLLIITGLFLLELVSFGKGGSASAEMGQKVSAWGLWGAFPMGVLFALTFCPTSAALFFGSLIPLAIEEQSRLGMPLSYGLGTALPVVAFAFVIAFSANLLGKMFGALRAIELWARRITGVLFIVIGIWLVVHYVFEWL